MENYFDDITFRIVAHRFKIDGSESFFVPESNSLEFIRSGELRLEYADGFRAAELLRTTGMRIKEIVFSCRFTSDVEFSRGFKKFSGLSPRAYREQCRRGGALR